MKILLIKSSALVVCLSLFAFSPANDAEEINYEVIQQFDDAEAQTSTFDEFETSIYTPSKAVYNRRVRYWSEFQSDFNAQQAEMSEVLDRN